MKTKVLGAVAIALSGALGWALPGAIDSLTRDPVDVELNRKACIMAVSESSREFVEMNEYEISDRAKKRIKLTIYQQCKVSVMRANGITVKEPKTLQAASSMLIDGLDYEEARVVRRAKKSAQFTGEVIGSMGVKELDAWLANWQDAQENK